MEHADSFIINIAIADMNRLTTSILDLSKEYHNTNVFINEGVYVIPPPYYLDWFEKYHPSVTLNWDEGTFCLQYMNGIQEPPPDRQQWNILFDAVIMIEYRIVMWNKSSEWLD